MTGYTDEQLTNAEKKVESVFCNTAEKECLCPRNREAGLCSDCQPFLALRNYYLEEVG